MPINYPNYDACSNINQGCGCLSKDGCPPGVCPDFTIRRHDTRPEFRVEVADCEEAIDLANRVLEVNMWAKAKLKSSVLASDTQIAFADGIGFDQAMSGDVIIVDRVRGPEHMLVTGFDEDARTISVTRGWHGTTASAWKKGTKVRIFRVMNSPAHTEQVFNDVEEITGEITRDVLQGSYFVYEWQPQDTCLPGCYWLEFKLIKMKGLTFFLPGGNWIGPIHNDAAGNFLTGSGPSDGAVLVSFVPPVKHEDDRIMEREHDAVEELKRLYGDWAGTSRLHAGSRVEEYEKLHGQEILHDALESVLAGEDFNQATYGSLAEDRVAFIIPHGIAWTGPSHLWSDGNYYTGSDHTSGSLYLSTDGLASSDNMDYDESGPVSVTPVLDLSKISHTDVVEVPTTSFTQCDLGVGVEWVRRFPREGDGFLIRITDSPTSE